MMAVIMMMAVIQYVDASYRLMLLTASVAYKSAHCIP
jgi:hypothetical protein